MAHWPDNFTPYIRLRRSTGFTGEEKEMYGRLEPLKTIEGDFLFLQNLRTELMARFVEMPASKPSLFFAFRFATSIALFVIFVTATGITFASQKSLPSNVLYPVKIASEKVRLALVSSPTKRAQLRVAFAERRIAEILEMQAEVATSGVALFEREVVENTLESFLVEISEAEKELEKLALAFENLEQSLPRGEEGLDGASGNSQEPASIIAPEIIPEPSPQPYTALVLELEEQFASARQRLAYIKDKLEADFSEKERYAGVNAELYQLQLLFEDIGKNLDELEKFRQ